MSKTLIVVESAGKIGELEHILGKGYMVVASGGHLMDLDPNSMAIDFENGFNPTYCATDARQKANIKKLKDAYKKCNDVFIASDDDREGEMIGETIASILGLKKPKRLVFRSITKKPVLEAMKNPRSIDKNMVNSQKMRRFVDRVVGYKLSPLVSRAVGQHGRSAGRVQSVAEKLVVEKEKEIEDFFNKESCSFFKFECIFQNKKNVLRGYLYTTKTPVINDTDDESDDENCNNNKKNKKKNTTNNIDSSDSDNNDNEEGHNSKKGIVAKIQLYKEAKSIMKLMTKSTYKISTISQKETFRYPSPPFETSTMQQEANNKHGFTAKRTMTAAQHLYEAGYITYMRTDSVSLSEEGIEKIEKYVKKTYGLPYHRKMQYKTKSKNAQEAHEAVRPTEIKTTNVPTDESKKIGNDEIKLYALIWKRTVASQMTPAKFNIMKAHIDISKTDDYYYVSTMEDLLFEGFLMVYNIKNLEDDDNDDNGDNGNSKNVLPKVGTKLVVEKMLGHQEYKRPPKRYNNSSLIAKLKKLDIGRPATYASFGDKIIEKNYAEITDVEGVTKDSITFNWDGKTEYEEEVKLLVIGKENKRYVPTSMGTLITNFLIDKFPSVMEYKFTSDLEKQLDKIAEGKLDLDKAFAKFYESFIKTVDSVDNTIKGNMLVSDNARKLGEHPELGFEIYALHARYGPVVKMIDPDKSKPIYAPIKPLTIDKITLAQAVELFEWPKELGKHMGKVVMLKRGKNGYWLTHGTKKDSPVTSLGKNDTITIGDETKQVSDLLLEDAIILMEKKSQSIYFTGKDDKFKYSVQNGPHGAYIRAHVLKGKTKDKTCSVPDTIDPTTITLEQIQALISDKTKRVKQEKKSQKIEKEKSETSNESNDENIKKVVKSKKPKKSTKK
jgi:DNA topoisomerase I